MLAAVGLMVLSGPVAALAQSVPVTLEVRGSDEPTEPTGTPTEQPTDPTSEPEDGPSPDGSLSPSPALGGEPPPAAADPPPDGPLARTGADVLRTVRDAAALIAAGLLLLGATKRPGRTRT